MGKPGWNTITLLIWRWALLAARLHDHGSWQTRSRYSVAEPLPHFIASWAWRDGGSLLSRRPAILQQSRGEGGLLHARKPPPSLHTRGGFTAPVAPPCIASRYGSLHRRRGAVSGNAVHPGKRS